MVESDEQLGSLHARHILCHFGSFFLWAQGQVFVHSRWTVSRPSSVLWLCWCWRCCMRTSEDRCVSFTRRTGQARPHSGCVEIFLAMRSYAENREFNATCHWVAFSRLRSERSLLRTTTHLVETLVVQRDDDDVLCRHRGRWGPTFSVDDLPCSSERRRCTLRDDFCISPFG